MKNITHKFIAGSIALILAGPGCESSPAPVPRDVGPVDSNSETGMSEPVPMAILDELVSDAGQWIATELPAEPTVSASPTQLVFAVPQTLDSSERLDDGRLRQTLNRLLAELQGSSNFTDSFIVITQTQAQANADIAKAAGDDTSAFRDPLGRDADRTRAVSYPPETVYTLSGKFYRSADQQAGRITYNLMLRADNPLTRKAILNRNFQYNAVWNGNTRRWQRGA
jgi:hypothetical protein